eukprot:gnl/TRDRNA2_/TRDRNA2_144869_c1_seq1.p1 gnl/TRDRNA2_/TRDRNA2_144869_c1~~gnl/TRDRNA2_/TRDRNA2_144869_c1_seq1.p1  ORF type:complete len:343 (+),score=45.88 gnl/TRDRNA2_/TRDRNA2_144869_c1_seq1:84-1112(+)
MSRGAWPYTDYEKILMSSGRWKRGERRGVVVPAVDQGDEPVKRARELNHRRRNKVKTKEMKIAYAQQLANIKYSYEWLFNDGTDVLQAWWQQGEVPRMSPPLCAHVHMKTVKYSAEYEGFIEDKWLDASMAQPLYGDRSDDLLAQTARGPCPLQVNLTHCVCAVWKGGPPDGVCRQMQSPSEPNGEKFIKVSEIISPPETVTPEPLESGQGSTMEEDVRPVFPASMYAGADWDGYVKEDAEKEGTAGREDEDEQEEPRLTTYQQALRRYGGGVPENVGLALPPETMTEGRHSPQLALSSLETHGSHAEHRFTAACFVLVLIALTKSYFLWKSQKGLRKPLIE